MYVPFNDVSTNTMAPQITGKFCQNLASYPNTPGNIEVYNQTKGSLVNYVNEAFFVQPKSLEIFLASQKRLFNRQPP